MNPPAGSWNNNLSSVLQLPSILSCVSPANQKPAELNNFLLLRFSLNTDLEAVSARPSANDQLAPLNLRPETVVANTPNAGSGISGLVSRRGEGACNGNSKGPFSSSDRGWTNHRSRRDNRKNESNFDKTTCSKFCLQESGGGGSWCPVGGIGRDPEEDEEVTEKLIGDFNCDHLYSMDFARPFSFSCCFALSLGGIGCGCKAGILKF